MISVKYYKISGEIQEAIEIREYAHCLPYLSAVVLCWSENERQHVC